jgi:beta-ureidopropionase / N-carbamoyl-L-amino-acid hydrolase
MTLSLDQLNAMPPAAAVLALHGLYEHSDWIAEQALAQRPFDSAAQLKHAMVQVLRQAGHDAQLR